MKTLTTTPQQIIKASTDKPFTKRLIARLVKNRKTIILTLLIALGLSQVAGGLYIKAKAEVAYWLIGNSWENRDTQQAPQKPWPWADTKTVARLSIPKLAVQQFVMQGTSGE